MTPSRQGEPLMSTEKRQSERSDLFFIVEFRPPDKTVDYSIGITRNISREGFSFECQDDLKAGEILEFRLKHPHNDLTVSASGKIIWTKETWYNRAIGIMLHEMDNDAANRLAEMISGTGHMPKTEMNIPEQNICGTKETGPETEKAAVDLPERIPEAIGTATALSGPGSITGKAAGEIRPSYEQPPSPDTGKAEEEKRRDNRLISDLSMAEKIRTPKRNVYVALSVVFLAVSVIAMYIIFDNVKKGRTSPVPASENIASPDAEQPSPSLNDSHADDFDVNVPGPQRPDTAEMSNILTGDAKTQSIITPPNPDVTSVDKHINIIVEDETKTGKKTVLTDASGADKADSATITRPGATMLPPSSPAIPQSSNNGAVKTEEEIRPVISAKTEPHKETISIPDTPAPPGNPAEVRKNPVTLPAAPKEEFIVHDEAFNRNAGKWEIFDTSAASAKIEDGEYRIENKRKTGAHIIYYYRDLPSGSDYSLEASVKTVSSPDSSSSGLIVGAKDAFNSYTFQIKRDGLYSIRKHSNGVSQELASGKIRNSAAGQNSANTLKVERRGADILFYVNGNYIDKIPDAPLFGNKAGFIVEGMSKIAVDRLRSQIRSEKAGPDK